MEAQPMFGWEPYADPGQYKYLLAHVEPLMQEPVPARSKYWASFAVPFDQGRTGTCVGQTGKRFLITAPLRQSRVNMPPSAFDLYDLACKRDPWPDNDIDPQRQFGTSIQALAEVLVALGYIKEYNWAFTAEEARKWLILGGPIMGGMRWYSSMMQTDDEGIVRITPNAYVVGGHAILFDGWDQRRGLYRYPQSWGKRHGRLLPDGTRNGWGWMPGEVLERLLRERGELCTAREIAKK